MGGRAGNIAVYATSNRRHLIKETLTDREGDDIHESDTRQELMSLSARFGLTITFGSPDREPVSPHCGGAGQAVRGGAGPQTAGGPQ